MNNYTINLVLIAVFVFSSCTDDGLSPGGSGLIEATDIIMSSESTGKILALYYDEGDLVSAGDTVAIIDTSTIVLRLHQVRALKQAASAQIEMAQISKEQASQNHSLAQKEFERITRLLKTGSANQQQYDQTENAYQQSSLARKQADAALSAARADLAKVEAELALLEKSYGDCFPTAPMAGRIVNKYIEAGELIAPGNPLIKIARLDTVWVKIYLPPADLTEIKLGGKAEIDPEDGRREPMSGFVSWISSEAEFTPKNIQTKEARADLVYAVKIKIPNEKERLKIGMPVLVTIPE